MKEVKCLLSGLSFKRSSKRGTRGADWRSEETALNKTHELSEGEYCIVLKVVQGVHASSCTLKRISDQLVKRQIHVVFMPLCLQHKWMEILYFTTACPSVLFL